MKTSQLLGVLLLAGLLVGVCTAAPSRLNGRERSPLELEKDLKLSPAHSLVERAAANEEKSWIEQHKLPVAIAGGAVGFIILLVVVIIVLYCCCKVCRRRAKELEKRRLLQAVASQKTYGPSSRQPAREPGVDEAFNRQKREKEAREKSKANDTVNYFLRNHTDYHREQDLSDLGSRMQKHWFKATSESHRQQMLLLTTTPVSQKCPLQLDSGTLKGISKLVNELKKHPFIQPIMMVDYLESQQQLVVVQPFREGGSLKDTIYRATPTTDWSNKYSRRSRGLTVDLLRLYGRQILEAMLFLYEKGFPTLGHVQSGNVFIVDGVCKVGGYENTLLGYKTRLFKTCKEQAENLDIIMFGHLLFEMCCGYELTQMCPGDMDYKGTKNQDAKEILQFIFADGFPHSIEEIKNHSFFASEQLPQLDNFDPRTVKITEHKNIQTVLEKVKKGKARTQKVPKKKKEDGNTTPVPNDGATPIPDKTPPPPPPPPQADKTPIAKGKSKATDKTPPPVTPVKNDDRHRQTPTSEIEGGLETGDSAGDQSGDSKEGKRKKGIKSRLHLGKKKKGSPAKEGVDHPDFVEDGDTTPIVTSDERA